MVGVIIYFFVAGSMGKWVGENIVEPVFSFFEQNIPEDSTPEVSPMADDASAQKQGDTISETSTQNIKTPSFSVFAIQTGAFSDVSNAKSSSEYMKSKGGAGYVYEEAGLNRVLISSYYTSDEAKSVIARIGDQDAFSLREYNFTIKPLNIEITAQTDTIEVVKNGFDYIPKLLSDMQEMNYAFDEGDFPKANEIYERMNNEFLKVLEPLEQKSDGTNNDVVIKEIALLKSFYEELENIDLSNTNKVVISSEIKYTQLDMIFKYMNMINSF